jgi:hypothetical protein
MSGALDLDVFEQPVSGEFFSNLLMLMGPQEIAFTLRSLRANALDRL